MKNDFKIKKVVYGILPYAAMIFALGVILLPVVSMVMSSFKSPETFMSSTSFFPEKFSLDYYRNVLGKTHFLKYLINSVVIGVLVSLFSTFLSILGGYALSRFKKRVKGLKVLYNLSAGPSDVSGGTADYPAVSYLSEDWDYKYKTVRVYCVFDIYTAVEYLDDAELF